MHTVCTQRALCMRICECMHMPGYIRTCAYVCAYTSVLVLESACASVPLSWRPSVGVQRSARECKCARVRVRDTRTEERDKQMSHLAKRCTCR